MFVYFSICKIYESDIFNLSSAFVKKNFFKFIKPWRNKSMKIKNFTQKVISNKILKTVK